jgi:undecaprenyl-phosphate 4-deoxy-4-formamido-L-arabinose transferase
MPYYSVVIAVYNSASVIAETVARLQAFFRARGLSHEFVLVNDASSDGSWQLIATLARQENNILALNLKQNIGEHAASLCGLAKARGGVIITMDDDLQTDPDDIEKLIAVSDANDVVFARFGERHHGIFRRLGGDCARWIIRRLCSSPASIYVSSFRLMHQDVVTRMIKQATSRSNINCLALLCAKRPSNVQIEEHPSKRERSNYTIRSLATLMLRTIVEHSLQKKPRHPFDADLFIAESVQSG